MDARPVSRNDQMLEMLLSDLGGNAAEESAIDFRAYWHIVLKHKAGIAFLTLLAAILSFLYTSSLVPRYQAVATMLYDPPSISNYGTVSDLTAMENYSSAFREFRQFKAQQMIMGSRKFAQDMVDKYELWNHPFFAEAAKGSGGFSSWKAQVNEYLPEWVPRLTEDPAANGAAKALDDNELRQTYRENAIAAVRGGMTVESQEDVMLLKLGFVSTNPDFAAEMANKLAEFYSQYELSGRMESFDRATKWLVERTQELKTSLLASEKALQDFKQSQDVGGLGSGASVFARQMEDVLSSLSGARRKVLSLEQTLARLESSSIDATQSVYSSALVNFPGVRAALEAEMDARKTIDQLTQVYGPMHPRMLEAVGNHQRLQEKLQSEIRLVMAGMKSDLNAARSNEQRLNAEFERLKAEMQTVENKSFRLTELERAKNTDQELYDLFVTRFKELNVGSDVSSPSVRILDAAQRPGAPFWPNNSRIVGMYSLLALFLGIGLAFLLEYVDKTIKNPDEVESKLGLPLLGALEQLTEGREGKSVAAESYFVDHNKSAFAEAIRTIRTGVMLSGLDEHYKVIVITSTVPGEGKTTVSMNLACAMGQLERVLLIDADMRRAALGPRFGIARNAKGLADVAAGLEEFSACVHHYEKGSVDILSAGTIPPNPQELLSSAKFRKLLEEVSGKYDRVIIDTSPTHLVSDPKLVARWASALIYVIRAESTLSHMAAREVNDLKKINKPIIGVVVNGMSKDRLGYGTYRYGGYRRKGYGRYGYGRYGEYGDES